MAVCTQTQKHLLRGVHVHTDTNKLATCATESVLPAYNFPVLAAPSVLGKPTLVLTFKIYTLSAAKQTPLCAVWNASLAGGAQEHHPPEEPGRLVTKAGFFPFSLKEMQKPHQK